MGEVFDRAVKLDAGLAQRWKARTKEDLGRRLSVADIEFILGPLFRSNATVTDKQGQAMFVLFENMRNTPEAGARIRALIETAEKNGRLQRELLDTDAELAPLYEALSHAVVGQIIFTSPGTGITYAPHDYAAACELIRKGHIKMYQNTAGRLSGILAYRGIYNTERNELRLNEIVDPIQRKITIVHEVTHAIQDWKDLPSLIHDEEADAHLADTIAHYSLRGRFPDGERNLFKDELAAAAKYVLAKQATQTNKDWRKAYDDLVKVVADYHKKPGLRAIVEKGKKESEIYRVEASTRKTFEEAWERLRQENVNSLRNMPRVPSAPPG